MRGALRREAPSLTAGGWIRTGYGLALIAWPGTIVEFVAGRRATATERALVRVLGLRETGQALVYAARPTPAVLSLGAGVDELHAATMLFLAARSASWRRPALVSAAVATTFAATASHAAGRARRLGLARR